MSASVRSVGAAQIITSTASTTVRPDLPTGWQEYDILLLVIANTGGLTSDVRSIDAFTQITARDNASNVGLITGWLRARADTVAPSITIDNQVTDPAIVFLVAIRDAVRSGNPISASSSRTNVSSTTATVDTITPLENDCLIAFILSGNANTTASGYSGSNPTFTEAFDVGTALNTGAMSAGAFGLQATAAATGSRTTTLAAATTSATALIAFRSEPAGTSESVSPGGAISGSGSVDAISDSNSGSSTASANTTGSVADVPQGAAVASGISPEPFITATQGSSVASGAVTESVANAPQGSSVAGSIAPTESLDFTESVTAGGAISGFNQPVSIVLAPIGGSQAGFNQPTDHTSTSETVSSAGATTGSNQPSPNATAPAGGSQASSNSVSDIAFDLVSSGFAIAGGFSIGGSAPPGALEGKLKISIGIPIYRVIVDDVASYQVSVGENTAASVVQLDPEYRKLLVYSIEGLKVIVREE